MKSKIETLLLSLVWLMLFIPDQSQAQVELDTAFSPVNLVNDVLLGEGIVAGNIEYHGSLAALARFKDHSSTFSIDSGIIITTGNVFLAQGPNRMPDVGWVNGNKGNDDLSQYTRGTIYDAAVLEFDFIAASENITFNYIFASEEYPEYVDSKYNDVFGFFLSGPDIDNFNLARLPRSDEPITINNVNHKRNKQYFIDNTYVNTSERFIWHPRKRKVVRNRDFNKKPQAAPINVQYDGMTKLLRVNCNVIPNEVYHIKIAISDVSDGILDSGVFLEANSFRSYGKKVVPLNIDFFKDELPPDNLVADIDRKSFVNTFRIKEIPTPVPDNKIELPAKTLKLQHIVEFQFDSYEVTDSAAKVVEKVAEIYHEKPESYIQIQGHTDSVGTNNYNINLSKARTRTIFDLLTRAGISPDHIQIDYFGETKPKMTNHTSEGRSRNRRVEMSIKIGN